MSAISFLPVTSTAISTDSGSPVSFKIINSSTQRLSIYWVDREGKEQQYGTLDKGGSYQQSSMTSHVWEVKSADGTVAFKFLPSATGMVTIGSDYKPSFTDYSEVITHTAQGDWSTAQGYGLVNVAKALGVEDLGGTLSLNGQSNNLALNAISASSAWAAGYTGKDIKVAIIDIGIATNSEVSGNIVGGYDFYDKDNTPTPANGAYQDHALGAAAIIAGSHTAHTGADTMGVAPDADLLNVRVGSINGSTNTNMSLGIRWAVDNGAKVICMPLQSPDTRVDPVLVDALHYAYQNNVVCVVIGGNFSSYGPTGPAMAALQLKGEIIDVGNFNAMASTQFDSSNMPGQTPFPWVMASSSGYVPNSAGGYTYHEDGGTSFAGPYVAGLAALLWEQNPKATAAEIISKITASASLTGSDIVPGTTPTTPVVTPVGQNQPDVHIAMGKDFVFTNTAKSDLYVGIDGTDTVNYTGLRSNFTVAKVDDHFTVTDKATGVVDSLYNVERLHFGDVNVALDVSGAGNGGEVYRLYQAAFNRAPDKAGLGFWMTAMDAGKSLTEVAKGFVQSAEFQQLYGANPTNSDLVSAMYKNVLHRAPEAAGLKFWVDALEHGETPTGLLTAFSESGENLTAAAQIIGQGFEYTPFG
jgi:subtilisin family serine protease